MFELLMHPFITGGILKMFEGKSLLKMALFLKKKSVVNFEGVFGHCEFDRIFNHPDLDLIWIRSATQAKKKELTEKSKKGTRDAKKKTPKADAKRESPDEARFFARLEEEERKLRTRIQFENEKLSLLLLKNDDILELKLLISKMDSLKSRIDKSRIRHFFEELLETLRLDLCICFDKKNGLFRVKCSKTCEEAKAFDYSRQKMAQAGVLVAKKSQLAKEADPGKANKCQKTHLEGSRGAG